MLGLVDTAIRTFPYSSVPAEDVEVRPLSESELVSVLTGSGFRGVAGGLPHNDLNPDGYPLRVRGFMNPGEYDQMALSNPIIASGQFKMEYYVSSLDWRFRPPGTFDAPTTDEELENTEKIREDFDNLSGGLTGFVRKTFSFMQHGFCLFEKVFRIDEESKDYRFTKLLWINPQTIPKWLLQLSGEWLGFFHQSERGLIPVSREKVFHHARRGNERLPEGESAYRSLIYYNRRKSAELQSDSISRERWGEGTLVFFRKDGNRAPSDNSKEMNQLQAIAELWQTGQQSYMILPDGWDYRIDYGGTAQPDPIPRLEYLDHQTARMLDDTLSELGMAKFGSQAVGREMRLATQRQLTGVCGEVCRAIEQQLIADYYTLNGWGGRPPRVTVGGFENKDTLAVMVQLIQSGAIQLDDEDRIKIKRMAGLE